MFTVDVNSSIDAPLPSPEEFRRWARAAYFGDAAVELAVSVVDSEKMTELNQQFRGKQAPTNVLSFPAEAEAIDGIVHLGDIVLCANVIESEAKQQHKAIDAHWAHMVVHGMLHLQSYDHLDDEQANIMESLETRTLASLGFPDPYTNPENESEKKPANE